MSSTLGLYTPTPEQTRERAASQQVYNIWRSDRVRPCPLKIIELLTTFSKEGAHRVVLGASNKGIELDDIYPCEVAAVRSIVVGKIVITQEEFEKAKSQQIQQLLKPWYSKTPFKIIAGSVIILAPISAYLMLRDK